jgi:hypothetical protein
MDKSVRIVLRDIQSALVAVAALLHSDVRRNTEDFVEQTLGAYTRSANGSKTVIKAHFGTKVGQIAFQSRIVANVQWLSALASSAHAVVITALQIWIRNSSTKIL